MRRVLEYWERRQQLADRCARGGALYDYVPQAAHQRFLIDAWLFLGKITPSKIRKGNWGTEKSDSWGNGELRQLALCGLGRPQRGKGGGCGEAGTVAHSWRPVCTFASRVVGGGV